MTRRPARVAILCALVAACATRHSPAPIPLAPPPSPDDGALHVSLTWAAPVDLDLYVTDPAGETLYFANNPTRAGARLEQDARCGALMNEAAAVEHARLAAPAPGRYRVGVDFIDACGVAVDGVSFRVSVARGTAYREAQGTLGPSEFKVIVLEFDVTEDALAGAAPSAPGEAGR